MPVDAPRAEIKVSSRLAAAARGGRQDYSPATGSHSHLGASCADASPPDPGRRRPSSSSPAATPRPTPRKLGRTRRLGNCLRDDRRGRRPAGRDLRQGRAHGLDRRGVPAAVEVRPQGGQVRRLRHRRGHRDRQPARRRDRLGDAVLGRHHRRRLERPLGHERRLDDARRTTGRRCSTSPSPTTTRRPSCWCTTTTPPSATSPPTSTARPSACARAAPTSSSSTRPWTSRASTFDFVIDDATIKGYDTDTTALQDLALGDGTRLDAVITSSTTAQGYIDEGNPVKIVGDPLFYEPLARRHRQELRARPGQPRRGGRPDRGGHARGRHPDRDLGGVVRRARPHRPAVTDTGATSGSGSRSPRRASRSG